MLFSLDSDCDADKNRPLLQSSPPHLILRSPLSPPSTLNSLENNSDTAAQQLEQPRDVLGDIQARLEDWLVEFEEPIWLDIFQEYFKAEDNIHDFIQYTMKHIEQGSNIVTDLLECDYPTPPPQSNRRGERLTAVDIMKQIAHRLTAMEIMEKLFHHLSVLIARYKFLNDFVSEDLGSDG